ncbi:PaaI family thioesterase [Cupriavidus sp. IDO]|uniref:PaaI family thioesterase n=1 Tax=Cupriavidus sp. IDO TaxID=1539142 RepID=UPI00057969F0|nr:PaaI family thioesterase [Cupriavidus sp. IDO]KWR91720.1 acyl-CoA thioesterase [Cupriavidus sp. IDO]
MPQAIARLLPRKTSQNGAIDPRMRHMVENVLMNSPVARGLGIRLEVIEPEHVELVLPFLTTNVTHGSIVHGGVIATLIDIAGAAAAASGANGDEVRGGATSSLTVQYLAPAQAATLRAVATVVRRGRRQVVSDIAVYAEAPDEGVLVAKALMSSAMF